jgi:hypothetical protein
LPKGRKLALTLGAATGNYIERLEAGSGKNIAIKRRRLRMHLKPFFGAMRLDAITSFMVERYKKKRIDAGSANGTVNRELATLSHQNRQHPCTGITQGLSKGAGSNARNQEEKNRNYRVLGPGGRKRNRTAVRGFAVLCIATLPSGRLVAAYRRAPRNWSRTPDGVWRIAHALVAGRRCAPYIG